MGPLANGLFMASEWGLLLASQGMVAPFQDTNSTLETNFRRDIHGATAAYYARHAGITGEFLMRHEGKKEKHCFFSHWVLLSVVSGVVTVSNPLKL